MLMLISLGVKHGVVLLYFNTSHVNVNLFWQISTSCNFKISIHLMLMLIFMVTLVLRLLQLISIHLMLMLIPSVEELMAQLARFQYISC